MRHTIMMTWVLAIAVKLLFFRFGLWEDEQGSNKQGQSTHSPPPIF